MTEWDELLGRLDQIPEENLNVEGKWLSQAGSFAGRGSGEFSFTRVGSRWLLQEPIGILKLVGDQDRALRAESGGLTRLTPGSAWHSEPAAVVLEPTAWHLGSEVVGTHQLVTKPIRDQLAGVPCWSVELCDLGQVARYRLWVADNGMRLGFESDDLQVLVTSVGLGYQPGFLDEEMLRILDYV